MKNTLLRVLRRIKYELTIPPGFFKMFWASIKGPTFKDTLRNLLP